MAKQRCSFQLFLLCTVFLHFINVLSLSIVLEDAPFHQDSQDRVIQEYVKYFARPTVSSPLKKFLDKPTTLFTLAKAAELAVDNYSKKSKRTCRLRGILDLKELRNNTDYWFHILVLDEDTFLTEAFFEVKFLSRLTTLEN